jgi:hypothetical protein
VRRHAFAAGRQRERRHLRLLVRRGIFRHEVLVPAEQIQRLGLVPEFDFVDDSILPSLLVKLRRTGV